MSIRHSHIKTALKLIRRGGFTVHCIGAQVLRYSTAIEESGTYDLFTLRMRRN